MLYIAVIVLSGKFLIFTNFEDNKYWEIETSGGDRQKRRK